MARGSAATAEPEQEIPHYTHRQVLKVLSGLMMAMLTAMISTSVISTALPTIVGELGGQDQLSWVASASLLTMTASTPLWGKLSDVFGRKIMFQGALLIFVLASIGAGFSQNVGTLIVARGLQGLGVGGLSALAQVILGDVVEPRQRGRYAGYMGAVFGVATVAGPLLGGFIVDASFLGWRWTFFVCIPLAIVAFAVIQKVLKLPRTVTSTKIDVFGAITITGAAATAMFLLSLAGDQFAWNSAWTYGLLAAIVVLVALAVVAERRSSDPILPPRLFRNPTFVLCSIGLLCMAVAMFGVMIYLPQYLQIVKGMSPTGSGLMTLPLVISMLVTSIASGQLVTRTGRYKIFPVAGMVFVSAALFLMSTLEVESSKAMVGVGLALLGIGLGLTLQILILAAQNAAQRSDLASTTSGLSFFRNLGGAMGVATFGAVLTSQLGTKMTEGAREAGISLPAGTSGGLGSPEQVQALPEPIKHIVLNAFNDSVSIVYLAAVPVALLGFFTVLFLKELPLRGSAGRNAPAADAPTGATTGAPAAAAEELVRPPSPTARLGAVGAVGAGRLARTDDDGRPDEELVAAGAGPFDKAEAVNEMSRNGSGPAVGGAPSAAGEAVDQSVQAQQDGASDLGGVPVRGSVRTAAGAPVASAALTLIGVDGHQLARALTLADGRYALPTPGPGTYVLIAATGEHEPQAATLVVGDKPVDFDLVLAGNGGLAGTVRGAAGDPVANAMVVVTDVRGEVVGTGRTGPDGEYSFGDVASGTYTLAVSAAAHRPVALPVEVGGNGQTRQDIEMPPGARVRGTIRNEAGEPVADARVTIVDAAGNVLAMMITGRDGEYAFADLTGGQYTVIASGYPPVAGGLSLSGGGQDEHDLKLGYPDE